MKRIPPKARKQLVDRIFDITKQIRAAIPLSELDAALREHGFMLVQEDGQPWSGFLCGQQGRCTIDLATLDGEVLSETCMLMTWYRMDSGRYETVAYLT